MGEAPITSQMRDVLIDHLDNKPVPVIKVSELHGLAAVKASIRHRTTVSLLARGWLRLQSRDARFTVITEAGREALAELLADYADALSRSGYLERSFPQPLPASPS